MSDQQSGTVRSVAWSELMPWLIIFRCFRLAYRHQMLLLSAVAALLTVLGWSLLGYAFSGSEQQQLAAQVQPYGSHPWRALTDLVPDSPFGVAPYRSVAPYAPEAPATLVLPRRPEPIWGVFEPVYGTWEHLTRPWLELFATGVTWTKAAFLLLCGLWVVVVWAFFGAAITRMAAVELAADERIGWTAMLRFAVDKWISFFMAPLVSLFFVLVVTVVIAVVTLLLSWSGITTIVLGIVWGLLLAGGALLAWLLLGLMFGWPLMWPTIATEGSDCFDAWNRSYYYVFDRPLHYLFYSVVAFLFGILGWILVANFAAGIIHLTYWAAHWGAGTANMSQIAAGTGDFGFGGGLGVFFIHLWVGALKVLAVGFLFSYFWSASTAIYLLMRQKVDATEMDEITLEEEEQEPYGLPPLKTDAAGVPIVGDSDDEE